jgi:ABC-type glycerol-3-phosphate transport system substrate-binding protein
MKRILFAVVVIMLLASVGLLAGGQKEPGAGEAKQARIWIWGEDEAPGLTDFLRRVGQAYSEKIDPSVKWEVTHLDIDEIYTGFYAAAEAKNAPELHTLWGGILGFEPGWAGHLAPISDYVSEKTLSHVLPPLRHDGYWNGKDWLVPLYRP